MATEKRTSQRIEVNEPGTITWQNESGDTQGEKVILLNLADNGGMLETSTKLPLRLILQLKVPSWQIDSSASVRYCRQRGTKYRIGVEMSQSIAAKPKQRRWT